MIKDHRTGEETANVDRILDGDLDPSIYAYLKSRAAI
jgi:peptide chain release factor 2